MRRIMLTFALMLCASQVEADVLFTPDSFTLNVRAVFNDTGTDTFCWQCGDANPLNDFQAVLSSFPDLSEAWTDFLPYAAGLVQLQSTATNYLGLDANFSLHAKLTAWGASLPESLVRPSVSFGVIPGRLLGVNRGTALVPSVAMEALVASSFDKRSSLPPRSSCPPGDLRSSSPSSFIFQNKSNSPPFLNLRRCSCSDPHSRRLL